MTKLTIKQIQIHIISPKAINKTKIKIKENKQLLHSSEGGHMK